MLSNIFRFGKMPQTDRAFMDAVIPGHNRILMGALGHGAADENLRPQVEKAENYHIDFIKADPGNGAALHSHDSEETFICLTGKWRVSWGNNGEDHIELDYLDGICCPPGVMRSFENISDKPALMMAIIGGKEPGHVIWAGVDPQEDGGRATRKCGSQVFRSAIRQQRMSVVGTDFPICSPCSIFRSLS